MITTLNGKSIDHLIGLEFDHGKIDCYSALMNSFDTAYSIKLTNYARPDDWWIHNMNLYADHFRHEGFSMIDIPLSELVPGDVCLSAIPDPRVLKTPINHCAIYLGDGQIFHHLLGRRSEVCAYGGVVKRYHSCWIRHKDVPIQPPEPVQQVNLMHLILPHKRQLLEEALTGGHQHTEDLLQ